MKVRIGFFIVMLFSLTMGCTTMQPIGSTTTEKTTSDSVAFTSQDKEDSLRYVETMTKQVLPGSMVETGALTRAQFDSLIQGLKEMPATSVSRSIYMTDPKMQTVLSIILDSLGKIHFKCATVERYYYEKSVRDSHYISSLQKELSSVNNQKDVLSSQVVTLKKTFWEKLSSGFDNLMAKILIIVIALGLIVAFIEWGWKKIKSYFWPL